MKVTPVLMVGGSGTRLWPMSRKTKPKQFQALVTSKTMFQETILRVSGQIEDVTFAPPVIIGAERYLSLIEEQLAEINVVPAKIVLEPSAQNTAAVAAIAAATVKSLQGGLALLLPSDSHMEDAAAFQNAVEQAVHAASDGWITTFGIEPDRPETGYGYIKSGETLGPNCHKIARFVEKPAKAKAEEYLAEGGYTWNAGLFLFDPDTMLEQMQIHAPGISSSALAALEAATPLGSGSLLNAEIFATCHSLSIDYAVMEKTAKAAVFGPVACGWSDVGSWSSIKDISSADTFGETIAIDTENCYIRADEGTLVTAIGVSDLIIVAHEGAVLILPQDRAQDVSAAIAEIKARKLQGRL